MTITRNLADVAGMYSHVIKEEMTLKVVTMETNMSICCIGNCLCDVVCCLSLEREGKLVRANMSFIT